VIKGQDPIFLFTEQVLKDHWMPQTPHLVILAEWPSTGFLSRLILRVKTGGQSSCILAVEQVGNQHFTKMNHAFGNLMY
jgi:hypothetical protein